MSAFVSSVSSRKFVVFLVVTFLVVYGTVTGQISIRDAIAYIGAAGAVYTAAEATVDALAAHGAAAAAVARSGGELQ